MKQGKTALTGIANYPATRLCLWVAANYPFASTVDPWVIFWHRVRIAESGRLFGRFEVTGAAHMRRLEA